jgi:uncharacterized protein (DUF1810 family)
VTFDLDRFVQAQDRDFEQARRELEEGRKRSHWIWYVFPQLAGLGSSPMAEAYGLQGIDEATAYLRHPVLRERLLSMMKIVQGHSVSLRTLMGSHIDALKLVSSMTLFREVGRRAGDEEVATSAAAILQTAAQQGFAECDFTMRALSRQA